MCLTTSLRRARHSFCSDALSRSYRQCEPRPTLASCSAAACGCEARGRVRQELTRQELPGSRPALAPPLSAPQEPSPAPPSAPPARPRPARLRRPPPLRWPPRSPPPPQPPGYLPPPQPDPGHLTPAAGGRACGLRACPGGLPPARHRGSAPQAACRAPAFGASLVPRHRCFRLVLGRPPRGNCAQKSQGDDITRGASAQSRTG